MCHLQYFKFQVSFTKYSFRLSTHMFSQASLWEFSINVRGASRSACHVNLILAVHMCLSRGLHTSGVRNQSEGCFPACLSSNPISDLAAPKYLIACFTSGVLSQSGRCFPACLSCNVLKLFAYVSCCRPPISGVRSQSERCFPACLSACT